MLQGRSELWERPAGGQRTSEISSRRGLLVLGLPAYTSEGAGAEWRIRGYPRNNRQGPDRERALVARMAGCYNMTRTALRAKLVCVNWKL
jgi:hypothetical protein